MLKAYKGLEDAIYAIPDNIKPIVKDVNDVTEKPLLLTYTPPPPGPEAYVGLHVKSGKPYKAAEKVDLTGPKAKGEGFTIERPPKALLEYTDKSSAEAFAGLHTPTGKVYPRQSVVKQDLSAPKAEGEDFFILQDTKLLPAPPGMKPAPPEGFVPVVTDQYGRVIKSGRVLKTAENKLKTQFKKHRAVRYNYEPKPSKSNDGKTYIDMAYVNKQGKFFETNIEHVDDQIPGIKYVEVEPLKPPKPKKVKEPVYQVKGTKKKVVSGTREVVSKETDKIDDIQIDAKNLIKDNIDDYVKQNSVWMLNQKMKQIEEIDNVINRIDADAPPKIRKTPPKKYKPVFTPEKHKQLENLGYYDRNIDPTKEFRYNRKGEIINLPPKKSNIMFEQQHLVDFPAPEKLFPRPELKQALIKQKNELEKEIFGAIPEDGVKALQYANDIDNAKKMSVTETDPGFINVPKRIMNKPELEVKVVGLTHIAPPRIKPKTSFAERPAMSNDDILRDLNKTTNDPELQKIVWNEVIKQKRKIGGGYDTVPRDIETPLRADWLAKALKGFSETQGLPLMPYPTFEVTEDGRRKINLEFILNPAYIRYINKSHKTIFRAIQESGGEIPVQKIDNLSDAVKRSAAQQLATKTKTILEDPQRIRPAAPQEQVRYNKKHIKLVKTNLRGLRRNGLFNNYKLDELTETFVSIATQLNVPLKDINFNTFANFVRNIHPNQEFGETFEKFLYNLEPSFTRQKF